MGEHARLSPSAASRWIACPASIRLADQVHDIPSETRYAAEGTLAHEGAEIAASYHFELIDSEEFLLRRQAWMSKVGDEETVWEMDRHIEEYVRFLSDIQSHENSMVSLEQRLDTGVPHCFGTMDAVLIAPGHLDVVDFKYGTGVRINAEHNPQLMLYSIAAVRAYSLLAPIRHVTMHIHQPRLNHITSWKVSVGDLYTWRDEIVIPAALMAIGWNAPFNPGEETCRFCPAAGVCRARSDWLAQVDFGEPDLLTPTEVAEKLGMVKQIKHWCEALEAYALEMAYTQKTKLPGYKVVLSGGRRSVPDPPAAIQVLIDAGYRPEQVAKTSLKTFGELEKLIGKDELKDILGDLVQKSEGKPAIVKESDRRPEASPLAEAHKDFGLQHDT